MSGPPVSEMSRRSKHLAIAATVFLAEVLVATTFARIGFVRSYLSDFLAVIFLYHLAKAVRDFPARPLAAGVFAAATIIELNFLNGRKHLDVPFTSLVGYDE